LHARASTGGLQLPAWDASDLPQLVIVQLDLGNAVTVPTLELFSSRYVNQTEPPALK